MTRLLPKERNNCTLKVRRWTCMRPLHSATTVGLVCRHYRNVTKVEKWCSINLDDHMKIWPEKENKDYFNYFNISSSGLCIAVTYNRLCTCQSNGSDMKQHKAFFGMLGACVNSRWLNVAMALTRRWGQFGEVVSLAALKGQYLFICHPRRGFSVLLMSEFELLLLRVSTMRVSKPTFLLFLLWLTFWQQFPWRWSEKPFF